LLAISRCFSGDIEAKPRRSFRIASTAILLGGGSVDAKRPVAVPPTLCARPTRRMPPRQKISCI